MKEPPNKREGKNPKTMFATQRLKLGRCIWRAAELSPQIGSPRKTPYKIHGNRVMSEKKAPGTETGGAVGEEEPVPWRGRRMDWLVGGAQSEREEMGLEGRQRLGSTEPSRW